MLSFDKTQYLMGLKQLVSVKATVELFLLQNSFQKVVGIISRLTKKANSLHGIPVICQFGCFKRLLYFSTD